MLNVEKIEVFIFKCREERGFSYSNIEKKEVSLLKVRENRCFHSKT